MKVKIISVTEDTIQFIVKECDAAFVNALRRTMLAEVPTMAIEDIFYFDNSSVIPDEVLAHRIGLVPLKTDLDNYLLPEKCDCEAELGCPKCRVTLNLNVEANEEDVIVSVYSGDIKSVDPNIVPVSQNILLAKLALGQAIRFEAYAQLNKGKVHSKFSPVSMAIFNNIAEFDVEDNEIAAKCVEEAPKGVLLENGKIKVINVQTFNKSPTCKSLLKEKSLINYMKNDEYIFTIESTGSLSPKQIVNESVKILTEKLQELRHKIEVGEIHDEIELFEAPTEVGRRLYAIGAGDFTDEDEEGGDEEGRGPVYDET
ncbi:DNA-directed RNA polymerase subunit D [Candidatus Bathyarchaeota archaeon]|nr:DNA-directed RNA polymerase subunit D [Candidatus Bathyarchaeota archaeon]